MKNEKLQAKIRTPQIVPDTYADLWQELEHCANQLAALSQTISAISVAASAGAAAIGPRTLYLPCTELLRLSHKLDDVTNRLYPFSEKVVK